MARASAGRAGGGRWEEVRAARPAGAGGALGPGGETGAARGHGGPLHRVVDGRNSSVRPGSPAVRRVAGAGEDHAAAVDRAFQRDSKRYDQGFALY